MDTSKATVAASRKPRRMRTNAEKRRIVEEAMAGEVSVAEVARRHEVNANLLFNWRTLYQQGLLDHCRQPAAAKLLAVQVSPAPSEPVERICRRACRAWRERSRSLCRAISGSGCKAEWTPRCWPRSWPC